jgi:quinoprotein glucose dehydrogenase
MTRGMQLAVGVGITLSIGAVGGAQRGTDQWPNHQHNSNFSPAAEITPENVARLVPAWTHNYGGGTLADGGFVGLDYRFEVQPLHVGDTLYISTPASMTNPDL